MEIEPRVVAARSRIRRSTPAVGVRQAAAAAPHGEQQAPAGSLDQRGRPAPADTARDDQLEIPAFLRRQSS